jgi:hypothetical protein
VGGDPPTGIELSWTERLLGDYNQDGLVTVNDLSPLGQRWQDGVTYDDPALHGGFAQWPAGDPTDDGGAIPPIPGSGADNWRLARIDGNGNGLVEIQDITQLGQHWGESIAGYRVYEQRPGETAFSIYATVSTERQNLTPIRYETEAALDADGVYAYYVAPVDGAGAEGPASSVLSVDVATGRR